MDFLENESIPFVCTGLDEEEAEQVDVFKKYGCEIISLTKKDREVFRKATQGVSKKYLDSVPDGDKFFKVIQEELAKIRKK